MKGKRRKTNPLRKRFGIRPFGIVAVAVLFALNTAVALFALSPGQYDLQAGQVSPVSIYAPKTAEDPVQTEMLRQAARNAVGVIYGISDAAVESCMSLIAQCFDDVDAFLAAAAQIREETAPTVLGEDGVTLEPATDARAWQAVIDDETMLGMLEPFTVTVTDVQLGYALLNASEDSIAELRDYVESAAQKALVAGIPADALSSTVTEISRRLQMTTMSVRLKSYGQMVYERCIQPTYIADDAATEAARDIAASAVEGSSIRRGSLIVEAGATVTSDQIILLRQFDLLEDGQSEWQKRIGIALYLLILYALFLFAMMFFAADVLNSRKHMLLLLMLIGISVLLSWAFYGADPHINACMFAILPAALLINRRTGVAVTLLTAFVAAQFSGGTEILSADSLITAFSVIAGGLCAIAVSSASTNRASLIAGGAAAGVVGAAIVIAGSMIVGTAWRDTFQFAGWIAASPLVLSVFSIGMMSVWESTFDIVTPARLHELMNTNHPLLRKLINTAPGTYHHSMMASQLAEAAAEEIGANAQLARVGALYHDVGKIRRPQYFSENQTKNRNIHDTLPPAESAGIIIAHVADSVALLKKHKLPAAVISIAAEHHGTTLVAYFYHKARQADGQADERDYRYPGPRPASLESAIVLLTDSCEAGVRSLIDPSPEAVAEMVYRIIHGKIADDQFSGCPITMQQIHQIEQSFLATFRGLLHERVSYPGDHDDDMD